MRRITQVLALATLLPALWVLARAESPESPAVAAPGVQTTGGGWDHQASVYLLAAGLDGQVTVRGLDADVDVSFSDILEDLEMGGMAAYRGSTGRWAFMTNIVYMGLGATKDGALGGRTDVDVDELAVEVDGAYRFGPRFELLFGLRGRWLDVSAAVDRPPLSPAEESASQNWVDPLVGGRVELPMGEKWTFVGRGDIGGFGVGSDLAWQFQAHFDWRFTTSFGVSFGYMALDEDYEDGEGSDRFHYDVRTEGPLAAVTFWF